MALRMAFREEKWLVETRVCGTSMNVKTEQKPGELVIWKLINSACFTIHLQWPLIRVVSCPVNLACIIDIPSYFPPNISGCIGHSDAGLRKSNRIYLVSFDFLVT